MKWSQWNFAHGMIPVLSWHARNFIAIWYPAMELYNNQFSIEFELRWKNRLWNGHQAKLPNPLGHTSGKTRYSDVTWLWRLSHHWQLNCSFKSLLRLITRKTAKLLCINGLNLWDEPPFNGFLSHRSSNVEVSFMERCHNVTSIIRHVLPWHSTLVWPICFFTFTT